MFSASLTASWHFRARTSVGRQFRVSQLHFCAKLCKVISFLHCANGCGVMLDSFPGRKPRQLVHGEHRARRVSSRYVIKRFAGAFGVSLSLSNVSIHFHNILIKAPFSLEHDFCGARCKKVSWISYLAYRRSCRYRLHPRHQ